MINQVAIVSQTNKIAFGDLTTASAAIQKQITRDVGPLWNLDATVDAFQTLADVPLGYWSVIIKDQIPFPAGGIHLNKQNGQPFALVKWSEDWPMTTSHETIEMLVDPSGNRTVAVNSPDPDQTGRVLALVEPCDPSEGAQFGYTVNGVLLSDFYTPRFFDPVAADGVRYSFSGAITKPLQVLDGGYMSWWDPVSTNVFQLFVEGRSSRVENRGPLPAGFSTLRSFTDSFTNKRRFEPKKKKPKDVLLMAALAGPKAKESKVDKAVKAHAALLQEEIDALIKG